MAHLIYHAGTAGKINRKEVFKAVCHTFRKTYDRYKNHSNEDINKDFTKYNIDFEFHGQSIPELVEERLENEYKGKRAIRKDAVVLREIIANPSKEFFEGMSIENQQKRMIKFVEDSLPWLKKEFGKNNVLGASIHLDETNPHVHFAIMPMTKDGRLSQKDFFKGPGDLTRQHREFREHLNIKHKWYIEKENKYENIDDVDLQTYKANAKKINEKREAQTKALRDFASDDALKNKAFEQALNDFHGMGAAELRRILIEPDLEKLEKEKQDLERKYDWIKRKTELADLKEKQALEQLEKAKHIIKLSVNEQERNKPKLPEVKELQDILEKETDGQFSVYVKRKTEENVLVDLRGEKPQAIGSSRLIRELTTVELNSDGRKSFDLKGNAPISYVLGYYMAKELKTQEQAHMDGLNMITEEHLQMAAEYKKDRSL